MIKKTKDRYKKDLLLDDKNFQVMMEWEKPYMKALVNKLKPTGDVLEIGFGLGYSANQIQQHKIKSHTIIEANSSILKKLKTWAKKQKHPVNIIEGTWQNKLKTLGKFDSIFLMIPHMKSIWIKTIPECLIFITRLLRNM